MQSLLFVGGLVYSFVNMVSIIVGAEYFTLVVHLNRPSSSNSFQEMMTNMLTNERTNKQTRGSHCQNKKNAAEFTQATGNLLID